MGYTKMSSNENAIRFRIRNTNTTGSGGQGATVVVSPYKGRIKRALFAIDTAVSANWVATVTTPQGIFGMSVAASEQGDHSAVSGSEAMENNFQDLEGCYVEVGDTIDIETFTGSGSTTSMYGWLFIE